MRSATNIIISATSIRTGGWRIPMLDELQHGDIRPFVELMLADQAASVGKRHGLTHAEEFRVVRFGGMSDLLEAFGERL